MEEEEIAAGTRKPFISEPVQPYPSWWTEAMAKGSSNTEGSKGAKNSVKKSSTIDTLVKSGAVKKRSKTSAISR